MQERYQESCTQLESEGTQLDDDMRDKLLIEQCGPMYKGRIYGMGHVEAKKIRQSDLYAPPR